MPLFCRPASNLSTPVTPGYRHRLVRHGEPGTFHYGTFHYGTFHYGTFHYGTFHYLAGMTC